QHQPGVAGQVPGGGTVQRAGVIQVFDLAGGDRELGHAGPPRGGRNFGAGLPRGAAPPRPPPPPRPGPCLPGPGAPPRPEGPRGREAPGDGEDPGVVVPEPETRWEHLGIGVIQLDPYGAAAVPDGQVIIEAAIGNPQLVQVSQSLAGEES